MTTNMLGRAIAIASVAFATKLDKGGKPYILHCLHVMNEVANLGSEAMMAAVLHDLVEDTEWTFDMLRAEGFPDHVIHMIDRLTHREGEDYDDYLDRVAQCSTTIEIKKADLRHNSDITRMKGLRDKDFKRLEKYHRAYSFLSQVGK